MRCETSCAVCSFLSLFEFFVAVVVVQLRVAPAFPKSAVSGRIGQSWIKVLPEQALNLFVKFGREQDEGCVSLWIDQTHRTFGGVNGLALLQSEFEHRQSPLAKSYQLKSSGHFI